MGGRQELAQNKEDFLSIKLLKRVWLVRVLTAGPRRHPVRTGVPIGKGSCRRDSCIGKMIELSYLPTLV